MQSVYCLYIYIHIRIYVLYVSWKVRQKWVPCCLLGFKIRKQQLGTPKSGQVETDIRYIWRNISPTWISLNFLGLSSLNLIYLPGENRSIFTSPPPLQPPLDPCKFLEVLSRFGGKKTRPDFWAPTKKKVETSNVLNDIDAYILYILYIIIYSIYKRVLLYFTCSNQITTKIKKSKNHRF